MKRRFLQIIVFGAFYLACTYFLYEVDAFDWLYQASREHEEWELDEISISFGVGALTLLLWFLVEVRQSHVALRQKIDELNKAHRDNETLEELMARAYRASPALFTITRLSDGKYIRVNESWTAITGHTEDDIQNQTDETLGLWQNPQDREYFILYTYAQKSLRNFETVFVTKSGEERYMLLSGEIVKYNGEDCLLLVGMDISDRYAVETTKNQFISIVSHELRTPLTSVQGSLKLLLGGTCGIFGERAVKLLHMAERNSERLLKLVDDILDLEKLRAGTLIYDMHHLQLDTLIKEAVQTNVALASQYQVQLVEHLMVSDATVNGDVRRLAQVMTHLISNALKASPPHNKVHIDLKREDDVYRISVTDHGLGIPEEFQDNIFNLFTQADDTDQRKEQGAGMGLAICKAIVEHHGGKIAFETHPELGTTFYFTLPAL